MTFDWQQFLALATWLPSVQPPSDIHVETIHRVCISRAYYAAYHIAWAKAQKKGWITYAEYDGHNRLHQTYKSHSANNIAEPLQDLLGRRKNADYDPVLKPTRSRFNQMQESIALAKQIIENVTLMQ